MQALKLDAVGGWRWIVAGWRLFRSQPFSFVALLFFYGLSLLAASVVTGWVAQGFAALLPFVPVDVVVAIGSIAIAMLTPALTVGFLQACRVAANRLPVHPILLFAPFRSGRKTFVRLLVLGAVQAFALVCILLLTSGPGAFRPDGPGDRPRAATQAAPASSPLSSTPSAKDGDAARPPTEAEQQAMQREAVSRIVQAIAYLPIALLMWYAPMLVAWHGLSAGKALFFSVVAVWRNRTAFLVYGIAWMGIWIAMLVAVGIGANLFGLVRFAPFIALPLVMLMLACMYCSVYPSYATVFVDTSAPPADPETPAVS